jgi:(2R)-ethylmalonyl-CoA mutase
MLAVVLSKDARARAVQLPAWNEALGLPRPWDQQWSLRLQQIVAEETDLLDYEDIFSGNPVIAAKVDDLKAGARALLDEIAGLGGAIAAVDSGFMKQHLVRSNQARLAAIESGETTVVGVNRYAETHPSPLAEGPQAILTVDDSAEREQVEALQAWRADRDQGAVDAALAELRAAASSDTNIMPASIACARAGVTTGEWGEALRAVFGEYRAPTGVGGWTATMDDAAAARLAAVRARVDALSARLGRRLKMLVGKPGLDGHSNGAEQIALRARDAGLEVVYEGIRLTPAQIVSAALEEGVHVVGLSVLSGSHAVLVAEVMDRLRTVGLGEVPVVVGGIIPAEDAARLRAAGVARVYTPKDFDLTAILDDVVGVIAAAEDCAA